MSSSGEPAGFRAISEQVLHEGFVISLANGTFEAPDGTRFDRDIVHHPGAVAVVPLAAAQIASARGDAAAYGTAALITVALVAIAVLMRSRARNLSLSY